MQLMAASKRQPSLQARSVLHVERQASSGDQVICRHMRSCSWCGATPAAHVVHSMCVSSAATPAPSEWPVSSRLYPGYCWLSFDMFSSCVQPRRPQTGSEHAGVPEDPHPPPRGHTKHIVLVGCPPGSPVAAART